MEQFASERRAQPFLEGTTPAIQSLIVRTADQITRSQYEAAKQAIETSSNAEESKEQLIARVCELMALSFREGIHLTLDTYGLREPIPVHAVGD